MDEDKSEDNRINSDKSFAQQGQKVRADTSDREGDFEKGEPQVEAYRGESDICDPLCEAYQVENKVDTPPEMELLREPIQEYMGHLLPKGSPEVQGMETAIGIEKKAAHESARVRNASISQVYPTSSQVSLARDELIDSSGKLTEENQRLRDMMEKLIKSGKEQLTAISSLSGRVKDLERRLSRKKKLKVKLYRTPRSGSPSNGSLKEKSTVVAM